jgi:hypothetical protein
VLKFDHIAQAELIINDRVDPGLVVEIDTVAQFRTVEYHLRRKMFGQREQGYLFILENKFCDIYPGVYPDVEELPSAHGAHKSRAFERIGRDPVVWLQFIQVTRKRNAILGVGLFTKLHVNGFLACTVWFCDMGYPIAQ